MRDASLVLVLGALSGSLAGCNNECDFFQRCNGNTREVCGDGVDQAFNRKIRSFPCEAPNELCVEMDESHAVCVLPPKTSCDETFVESCEGSVRTLCPNSPYADSPGYPTRFVTGEECAADGGTCVEDKGMASCQ